MNSRLSRSMNWPWYGASKPLTVRSQWLIADQVNGSNGGSRGEPGPKNGHTPQPRYSSPRQWAMRCSFRDLGVLIPNATYQSRIVQSQRGQFTCDAVFAHIRQRSARI